MKKLRKVLAVVLMVCLLASFVPALAASNGAAAPSATTTSAATVSHTLKAGAGAAEIKFSADVLKAAQNGREGFSGEVDTYPYARVLLLEDETRVAIISLELVQISSIVEPLRQLVAAQTNTPVENVWLHVNHTISTPHGSEGEYYDTVAVALTEACKEAMASFAPATMSVGTVELDINRNRNIAALGSNGERIYGLGSTEDSNKIMTILEFDAEKTGTPIGFFISYGIKPTTLDNSEQKAGTRVMSYDLTGLACEMVEDALGAPCMFAMPAAGDQFPADNALHYEQGADGQWTEVDKGVEYGLKIINELGTKMGNAAISLIKSSMVPMKNTDIAIAATTFTVTSAGGRGPGGETAPAPTELPLNAITIGDVAFVGFQPELDYQTEKEIWEASPYGTTLLVSFLNGDSKYMPHDAAWDYNNGNGSYEMGKSGFARGSAEVLRDAAIALLNKMNAPKIVGIETYGFVDTDGAKVSEIVVHYDADLTGAKLDKSYYEVTNRGTDTTPEVGDAKTAGQIKSVSVSGKDVTITVNTDYQLGSVSNYAQAMYASVKQVKDITVGNVTIPASAEAVKNYTESTSTGGGQGGQGGGMMGGNGGGMGGGPNGGGGGMMGGMGGGSSKTVTPGSYHIAVVEDFKLFAKDPSDVAYAGLEVGKAFHAEKCWDEMKAQYVDVDLPYALYVPANYNPSKEYALVLQIEDAGSLGDDPMVGITESQGAVNFASEAAQKLVKDAHGLAGVIVVVPQINNDLRSTQDNYSTSAAVPATWKLLDYLTDTYNISENHIYGTGQSMGGMQVVAMAAQRDNYFAGVWANGCQWGNNYNLEAVYSSRMAGTLECVPAPADGTIIWTKDADGKEVDYRNWYYLISDDNLLITNCMGDHYSTTVWTELKFLYKDLAGVEIPYVDWNPLDTTVDQEATANSILKQDNDFGFYWTAFSGGSHMATWIYSHGVWAHTEWLLSQDRATEQARAKLDLDKPFELADKQIKTEDRAYDGGYFLTGKLGAGTADYNSGWFNMNGAIAVEGYGPGWTKFTDVNLGQYYGSAVMWALNEGITKGTNSAGTTFSPNKDCTRAQIVTFLWRAAGMPEPTTTNNPFTDVDPVKHADYYKAILWAVENGITEGTNSAGTTFSPDATCTRAQIVTFLWRYAEKPEAPADNPFTDVAAGEYYTNAVLWAVENGVTNGTGNGTTFSPSDTCTRAQCVTFLYRLLVD